MRESGRQSRRCPNPSKNNRQPATWVLPGRNAAWPCGMSKRPFDIDLVMERIGEAVRPYKKAAMFDLADQGYGSLFEMLVACIISIRTRDEATVPVARRLFQLARTAAAMSRLTARQIDAAIGASTFHEPKARQILEISRRIVAEHGGELPCDF